MGQRRTKNVVGGTEVEFHVVAVGPGEPKIHQVDPDQAVPFPNENRLSGRCFFGGRRWGSSLLPG